MRIKFTEFCRKKRGNGDKLIHKDDYFRGIGPVKNIFQLIGYFNGGM
ncbi:hypothetical protein [Sphingobacterium multivorum]|nr:hypothetical protein [Sphingobacterium multivorum]